MKTLKTWVAAAALMAMTGTAQAVPIFEGRDADNKASTTCTVSGPGKCTSFYFTTLDITILNNWNIGTGDWDTAQDIAANAGFTATGLNGWVLPTGDGSKVAGAPNQYRSIWNAVGSSLTGLQGQFDGVQSSIYWSGTEFEDLPLTSAWGFGTSQGGQSPGAKGDKLYAVAVRPGDVTAAVPEPGTLGLLLAALGVGAVVRRRRAH